MGLIRKAFSISMSGGLIGYRSRAEKVERNVRQAAKAAQQTAVNSRRQTRLIEEQNGLIEEQTDAIVRSQQALIAQQAEAIHLQQEQLRILQSASDVRTTQTGDPELKRARGAALGAFKALEQSNGNDSN